MGTGTQWPKSRSPRKSGAAIKDFANPAAWQKMGSKIGGFSQQNVCGGQNLGASGRTTTSTLTCTGRVGGGGAQTGRAQACGGQGIAGPQATDAQGTGTSTWTVRAMGGAGRPVAHGFTDGKGGGYEPGMPSQRAGTPVASNKMKKQQTAVMRRIMTQPSIPVSPAKEISFQASIRLRPADETLWPRQYA